MIKQHTVSIGAITGLVVGVIVFAVGNHSTPDMVILKAINAIQTPLIPIVAWLQGASHNWGPDNSGLYKLLILIAAYWALIGAVIGLCCRLIFARRVHHAA